jgi:hypothetical protein
MLDKPVIDFYLGLRRQESQGIGDCRSLPATLWGHGNPLKQHNKGPPIN